MSERLNQRRAAERLGVTPRRLRALEGQNRIARDSEGTYAPEEIDTLRASMDAGRVAADRMGRGDGARAPVAGPSAVQTTRAPAPAPDDMDQHNRTYLKARAAKQTFEARKAELSYRKDAGELIDAKAAKLTSFAIARKLQSQLLTMKARLGPYLEADGKVALEAEIRNAITEMQEAIARL